MKTDRITQSDIEGMEDFNSMTKSFRQIDLRAIFGTGYSYSLEYAEKQGGDEIDLSLVKGEHLPLSGLIVVFVLYCLFYWSVYFLTINCAKKKLEDEKKALKIAVWTASTVNAVIGTVFFFIFTFVSCYIPGETFYTDVRCFDWASPSMEVFCVFALAYFSQDFYSTTKAFGKSPLYMQMLFHHAVVIVGTISALIFGRIGLGISLAMCFNEISTIFLNFRSMMMELNWDKAD